ncbi:MAG: hypothetical protein IJ680_09555 [Paludibacteraceae bacterium]|nr:hypothetical protein [Paludibacteraceae bacterium]
MKKIAYLIFAAFCLISCGGDDDEPTAQLNQVERDYFAFLNGKFVGEKKDMSADITAYQEITFYPYDLPKSEHYTEKGAYVNIEKNVMIFGVCDIIKYYNDHLMETTEHWLYGVSYPYEGADTRLYFYPDLYGRYETHYLTNKTSSTFEMDGMIYNKQ